MRPWVQVMGAALQSLAVAGRYELGDLVLRNFDRLAARLIAGGRATSGYISSRVVALDLTKYPDCPARLVYLPDRRLLHPTG
jgi:hypothetical protein